MFHPLQRISACRWRIRQLRWGLAFVCARTYEFAMDTITWASGRVRLSDFAHLLSRRNALVVGASGLSIGLTGLSALRPLPAQSQVQGFTFALFGDLGYVPSEEPWLENVLADLSKDSALSFVVHVGDLSSPRYGCTDEMQARRLAQFNALPHPLIYTPGDNEWTDCHEGQNVKGFDPLERLAKLRTVFFQGEQSLGKRTMPLLRQSQDPGFRQIPRECPMGPRRRDVRHAACPRKQQWPRALAGRRRGICRAQQEPIWPGCGKRLPMRRPTTAAPS